MNNHDEMHSENLSVGNLEGQSGRILARKVARELTQEEVTEVAGGMMAAGVSHSGPCCEADDCC